MTPTVPGYKKKQMSLYKILNTLRRIYWYLFRPKTIGVKCLIENQHNEYLLIKTTYSGNYWTLPGGGCKNNESFENCVIREVKEEVGLILQKPIQVGSYVSTLEYKKDTIHLFLAKTNELHIKKNTLEILEAAWFKKENIPENRSKALDAVLAKL